MFYINFCKGSGRRLKRKCSKNTKWKKRRKKKREEEEAEAVEAGKINKKCARTNGMQLER